MNTYRLRYIAGPQEAMHSSHEHLVKAESFDQALATRSHWPIQYDMTGSYAWAKHPGTSLYDVEAWEAELLERPPER